MTQLIESTEDRAHLVSALASVEIHCALRRLTKAKSIADEQCTAAIEGLEAEQKRMIEHPLSSAVLEEALAVSDRCAVRALDAMQIATAVQARAAVAGSDIVIFVSSDRELLEAARSEGFEVWEPLDT